METKINGIKIIVNEMSIKNNSLPDGDFLLNPNIQRTISKSNQESNTYIIDIKVDIHDKPDSRFPLDVSAHVSGFFNIEGDNNEEINSFLKIQGFQMVFPFVRSLIANATSNAMMPPLMLPIVYADSFDD